ncbi:MAG TPA: lysophospholipid acyltransferase family protein [Novosphingobium sp.]|nr:lysophospholipid acyltransferase family protein [Novosphingobium sp.]HNN55103.1 lysophospholipid acyltransferase family protein [Novosphingobium sp.]
MNATHTPETTGLRGKLRQIRAGAALLAVFGLIAVWTLPWPGPARRVLEKWAWSLLLSGFGLRLRCHGAIAPGIGVLTVANHISWIDIAVLARTRAGGFVAKSEVAGWPVIGVLARRLGCVFVDRQSRIAVHPALAGMELRAGRSGLVLFPEGTTSDGRALLPFRSSLLAGAECWQTIQPMAISYRERDGSALSPASRRAVAWIEDDALLPHAFALAAKGGATVDLWFEQPVVAADRKEVARACHAAISARLDAIAQSDQAATLKRAA